MVEPLPSCLRFLWAGLVKRGQTGAIVPSQRFLVARMIAPVPATYRGQIVELGAGSGALTVPLATRCPHARVLACEINPALAQECRRQIMAAGLEKRVDVLADSAQNLLAPAGARKTGKLDYIISGIPLANLGKEPTLALIETIHRALAEGGSYIQFQHSLVDRNKIRAKFRHLRTLPVLLNFPPAVVYHAQK